MPPIVAAQFPSRADCNPYISLLKGSLAQAGITSHEHSIFLEGRGYPYPTLDFDWLRRHQGRVNIIHFHWLQKYYRASSVPEAEAKIAKFEEFLSTAHDLDYRIAYTFHNFVPHEGMGLQTDLRMRRAIINHSDVITCFSHRQKAHLEKHFGEMPIHVIPHASYDGCYPDDLSSQACRDRLGLPPKAKVLSFIGLVRPYKNLPRLIEEFVALDPPECYLVLAGTALDPALGENIAKLACGKTRTICHLRWIKDEEVQLFMKAADAVVLPYEKCWTSGSIMLAFTFGRPVISADPVMLDHTDGLGFFYRDGQGLGETLMKALDSDSLEAMGHKCAEFARTQTWQEAGHRLADAYRTACQPAPTDDSDVSTKRSAP